MRFDALHFDWVAPVYDRVFGGGALDGLERDLAVPLDGWVIDVGGGTGRAVAAGVAPHGRVVVVDRSRGMLRQATARSLMAVQADAARMPFASGSAGGILIVDALHHFRDQDGAMREIVRILGPGGRIVLEEPDIRNWAVKAVALGERLALMQSRFMHPAETALHLQRLGVRLEGWSRVGHSARLVFRRPC